MFLNYVDIFLYVDNKIVILPKWKENAKEFTVSVNYNEIRGYQSSVPKPIMELLGDPEKVTFVVNGDNIKIIPAKELSLKEKKRFR